MGQVKKIVIAGYDENIKSLVDQANELIGSGSELSKAEARGMLRVINVLEVLKDSTNVPDDCFDIFDILKPETESELAARFKQNDKDHYSMYAKVANQDTTIGLDGMYGHQLNTLGELRDIMVELSDEDQICIEAIDLQTGDVQDLYPMNVDVIPGIKLTNGKIVNEVRFCQMMNSKPDTRDKQPLVDAVIEEIMDINNNGDQTVLDELLETIPWEILKQSLPEDKWERFNRMSNK